MAIGLGCLYSAIEKTIIMLNTQTVQITWRIPMIDWKIRNRIHDVWPIHLLSSDANERWSTHQFNKWYICSWFKTCYMCTPCTAHTLPQHYYYSIISKPYQCLMKCLLAFRTNSFENVFIVEKKYIYPIIAGLARWPANLMFNRNVSNFEMGIHNFSFA